jgi:hypothetical protein
MVKPRSDLLGPGGVPLDDTTVVVVYGGERWPVPKLAFAQLKKINQAVDRLFDLLLVKQVAFNTYSDGTLDDLAKVVFVALTRAHPELTFAEFEEMPTDRRELSLAFFPIFEAASGKPKSEPSPGEAVGAESPST